MNRYSPDMQEWLRNIGEKLGYQIADPGKWCGFPRPAFLSTEDEHFDSFAAMYYEELEKLYGKAKYYSMDPFMKEEIRKE